MANTNQKNKHVAKESVSSYQMIHMKLGHVILSIVITIPRNEVPKFKENDNALYQDTLKLINGRLSQILQREQNRKHEKKSKSKANKYQIYKASSIKIACKMEEKRSDYCFVHDALPKNDANPIFTEYCVSPLVLNVYAVSNEGFLPFSNDGDVIISQFYATDDANNSNNSNNSNNKKKNRKRTRAK